MSLPGEVGLREAGGDPPSLRPSPPHGGDRLSLTEVHGTEGALCCRQGRRSQPSPDSHLEDAPYRVPEGQFSALGRRLERGQRILSRVPRWALRTRRHPLGGKKEKEPFPSKASCPLPSQGLALLGLQVQMSPNDGTVIAQTHGREITRQE